MPLNEPPTEPELRATFERMLDHILNGEFTGCPTDTGLDVPTMSALDVVGLALASGRNTAPAVAMARQSLEDMLDGTHAQRAQDERIEFARRWDMQHLPPRA